MNCRLCICFVAQAAPSIHLSAWHLNIIRHGCFQNVIICQMKCDNSSLCIISCILASSFHYFFVLVVFGDNINISQSVWRMLSSLLTSRTPTLKLKSKSCTVDRCSHSLFLFPSNIAYCITILYCWEENWNFSLFDLPVSWRGLSSMIQTLLRQEV